ncbi:23S rRNA (uracil(1939)-C(5))-methyltransferase RlmD [bacterium]|nr:23S rRNA (uracil(1939)-C(5))-methyltransferase RlmD [bacterium]
MLVNDEFDVSIEAYSNLGKGIAKIDGQVVFVENACTEDLVKIKITDTAKNYANARVIDVIKPSEYRTEPICPLQKVCGSCQLGFIDYNYQLKLKKQFVEDAMKRIGGIDAQINDVIPSPKIKNYRQKIQYPVCQTKNSKRILAGYYKLQSHEIVNIKYCPVQPEICDEIIEFIRKNAPEYGITGYDEKRHIGDLRHIVVRGSEYSGKFLVTLVMNKSLHRFVVPLPLTREALPPHPLSLPLGEGAFAQEIFNNFDEVSGVCLNFNDKKTNVILGDKTICVAGSDYVEEKILDKIFKIGADTFFQINPKSAENIFKYVKNEVLKFDNPTVLDAYAGIATFGIIVSDISKNVVSVEENKSSIEKAKEVLRENNIENVELFAQDTVKYLKSIKRKFDITILDPPRKGCTQEVLEETLKHTSKEIIYVSCNPATLARDLKYLISKGCKVKNIQPFDMFCHTYHVETVAVVSV